MAEDEILLYVQVTKTVLSDKEEEEAILDDSES